MGHQVILYFLPVHPPLHPRSLVQPLLPLLEVPKPVQQITQWFVAAKMGRIKLQFVSTRYPKKATTTPSVLIRPRALTRKKHFWNVVAARTILHTTTPVIVKGRLWHYGYILVS